MANSPRILLYDIETSPNVAYTWEHYETNVIAYERQWELLSFSYKWLGESSIKCLSRRTRSEKELVKALHSLFDEADFLIAHNGDAFDWKKTNAKFIEFRLLPPTTAVNIDTKKLAKKYFKFNTNKLDDLCEKLGIGRKIHTGGFDLWLGCMRGDKSSFLKMEEYNRQDVKILEKLYLKLRPWIERQPGLSIALNHQDCPCCGGRSLVKNGLSVRSGLIRQRFLCKSCGGQTSGKKERE